MQWLKKKKSQYRKQKHRLGQQAVDTVTINNVPAWLPGTSLRKAGSVKRC